VFDPLPGTGNLETDPMFVDPPLLDFHLHDGSPCIGDGRYGGDMGAIPTSPSSIDEPTIIPEAVILLTNYPNPFNNSTSVLLELSKPAMVKVTIVNLTGQFVDGIYSGPLSTGNHTFTWQASGPLASGVYFAVVDVDGVRMIRRKMMLLR
jgi:hypothetical protein